MSKGNNDVPALAREKVEHSITVSALYGLLYLIEREKRDSFLDVMCYLLAPGKLF